MRKGVFGALFCAGILFMCESPLFAAISIGVTGGCNLTVTSLDLIGGVGTNLTNLKDSYESESGVTMINITGTTGNDDAWKVQVRKSGTSWPSGVTLQLKRTGEGTGAGAISGRTNYVTIGASDADFFEGSGDKTGIPVQYKVSGISLAVPPGAYSTTVVYTVVDL